MAIRLSKFQASAQSPVAPPVAPAEEITVADLPVAEEEQVEVADTPQADEASWGAGVLRNIAEANEPATDATVAPDAEAESEYVEDDDAYDDMFYMADEYDSEELNPLERIGSSVDESFAPDDDAVPETPTPATFNDYGDEPDELNVDESDIDALNADDAEPAYVSPFTSVSTATPYATADPDAVVPDDVAYSDDGAYILKDADGQYFPWALKFLQTLDEDDALSLEPDDYQWWEAIFEGTSSDDMPAVPED